MSAGPTSLADGPGTAPDPGGGGAAGTAGPCDEAALEWQVTLWSGEVAAEEREAFERWLHADPAHAAAWQRVQRVSLRLLGVPTAVAGQVLRRPAPRHARRQLLRGLGVLVGTGVFAQVARETPQWLAATADYGTARGERRDVTLPDGTAIALNTASAIDLRYTERERRVVLQAGEILVTTAQENAAVQRPFVVETAAGTLRAVGTRFDVRCLDEGSPWAASLQVLEGAVEVTPGGGTGARRVAAGEQARFNGSAVEGPWAGNPLSAAWARGLLVAERQRLEDFVAELARYRPGVLRCDPAVAGLVVSGVYPVGDTDAVLRSLAQALPVAVRMTTRYWVTVTAP